MSGKKGADKTPKAEPRPKKAKTASAAKSDDVPDQRRVPLDDANKADMVINPNTAFIKEYESWMATILDEPIYENIQTIAPLEPEEGGSAATFDQTTFNAHFKKDPDGSYDFNDTLFLMDLWWRPVKSSPINTKGIQDIYDHNYKAGAPNRLKFIVTLAVDSSCDMSECRGQLKRVSPEEPVFAFMKAVAGAKSADEKKKYMSLMRQVYL